MALLRRQRVEKFSPGGARAATIDLLTDGLGQNQVQQREIGGTVLVRYDVKGWFRRIAWEDADTVLLHANGRKRSAVVRCDGFSCERASRLRRAVP